MTYKEALEKIATVNAMDYEYQAWAREALAKQEQKRPQNCGTSYCSCIECVMGEQAYCNCKDPSQCWEPCGELGNSEEHAKVYQQEHGEPYAYEIQEGDSFTLVYSEAVHKYKMVSEDSIVATLYAAPQQRTWVGLTDVELADCMTWSIKETCQAIEAKLKEKNNG